MFYSQEQIDRANSTNIEEFLRSKGEAVTRSGKEVRWKAHDSVTIKDNKWFRHSRSKGGFPLDFVMEFYGVSFPEAMEMLIKEAGSCTKEVTPAPAPEFKMPMHNVTNANVIKYLTECRGISEELVTAFIDSGDIYEEAGHHNAVFVGRDPQGLPRYAHCRGTNPDEKFRIDIPGSDKAYNFSYEGTGDQLAVFEAPIDLLSFIDTHRNNWEKFSYLSLGGVGYKALEQYLKDHSTIRQVFLCLDSDAAGDEACSRLSRVLPDRLEVYRMRPQLKDWNEILISDIDDKGSAYRLLKRGEKEPSVNMIRMSDVEQTEVEWLYKPYIPFGKVTIVQGNPGEGKTYFAMNLAAACTNRQSLPGLEPMEPFNVIYQTAEDGLGDTVKPRLIEAGADLNRVLCIDDHDAPLTLDDDRIEWAIVENHARLLIIDPIQAFLGADVDMNRANEVRPIFRKLGEIAQRTGCAIILIGHLNKAAGMQSTYRGLGSIDITAAVRSVLFIGKKKDDPNIRVLTHEKSSLAPPGPSLAFALGDEDGFRWIGEIDISADEMLSGCSEKKENKGQQARDLICQMLSKGKRVPNAELEKAALDKGISSRTLRDAKAELSKYLRSEFVGKQKVFYMDI